MRKQDHISAVGFYDIGVKILVENDYGIPVGTVMPGRIKKGDASPYPVETTPIGQWKYDEVALSTI